MFPGIVSCFCLMLIFCQILWRGWDFRTSSTSSEARTENDRDPNLKSRKIYENQQFFYFAIWHLLTPFGFRSGHGLACQTRLARSATAVANMKPVSDFCRTCWLMFSHGSGRIDEEVENLYSTWELLSAEAGRLSCFHVLRLEFSRSSEDQSWSVSDILFELCQIILITL
jgi:hypothetical protein